MARRIQANYDELARISQQFSQQASESEQTLQRIQNCVGELQAGGWIGRGADGFYAEMDDEVFPALQRLCRALEDGASTMRRLSDIIRQAEEEAAGTFMRR
jgi:WXG100 family type VII secretion target